MNEKKPAALFERVRTMLRVFPFLLPLFVISISLGSSFLIAENSGVVTAMDGNESVYGANDALEVGVITTEPQQKEGNVIDVFMGRSQMNKPPILTAVPTPTTSVNTPVGFALPVADPADGGGPHLPITSQVLFLSEGGNATIDVNHFVTYTPDAGFTGSETITIRLIDSLGAPSVVEVTVVVS